MKRAVSVHGGLVHELWLSPFARIYLLRETALHRSHIYYHISRKKLENSQIYERTFGQINTAAFARPPSPVSAEFFEWQDAKWADIIPFRICRIVGFLPTRLVLVTSLKNGRPEETCGKLTWFISRSSMFLRAVLRIFRKKILMNWNMNSNNWL